MEMLTVFFVLTLHYCSMVALLYSVCPPVAVCVFSQLAPVHVRQAGVCQQLFPEQGGDAAR